MKETTPSDSQKGVEMKDIKDYLHLYLGAGCIMKAGKGVSEDYYSVVEWSDIGYPHNVTALILRPLSDMTEEEASDLIKFESAPHRHASIDVFDITDNHIWYVDGEMWHGDGVSEMYDKYIKFNELSPDQFKYLLSKGFDLFGLIEAGLAINATTFK